MKKSTVQANESLINALDGAIYEVNKINLFAWQATLFSDDGRIIWAGDPTLTRRGAIKNLMTEIALSVCDDIES